MEKDQIMKQMIKLQNILFQLRIMMKLKHFQLIRKKEGSEIFIVDENNINSNSLCAINNNKIKSQIMRKKQKQILIQIKFTKKLMDLSKVKI